MLAQLGIGTKYIMTMSILKNSIPKPVVDGQVFGALIVKQIQATFGKFSRIKKMKFNYKNMVFQDEEIEIKSNVLSEWKEDEKKFLKYHHQYM